MREVISLKRPSAKTVTMTLAIAYCFNRKNSGSSCYLCSWEFTFSINNEFLQKFEESFHIGLFSQIQFILSEMKC